MLSILYDHQNRDWYLVVRPDARWLRPLSSWGSGRAFNNVVVISREESRMVECWPEG